MIILGSAASRVVVIVALAAVDQGLVTSLGFVLPPAIRIRIIFDDILILFLFDLYSLARHAGRARAVFIARLGGERLI